MRLGAELLQHGYITIYFHYAAKTTSSGGHSGRPQNGFYSELFSREIKLLKTNTSVGVLALLSKFLTCRFMQT